MRDILFLSAAIPNSSPYMYSLRRTQSHGLAFEDNSELSKQSLDALSWVVREYTKNGGALKKAELKAILG